MCFYWTVELKTRTQKTHMSNLSQAVRFSLTLPLWTIYILRWTRQTCGLKKLTGKMEMMLQRNEWISLIGCRTFQRYVFFLLDLFELQELFVTKYGAIFSSLNILRRTYRSGYDELLVIRLFFRNAGNWRINLWREQFSRAVFESPFLKTSCIFSVEFIQVQSRNFLNDYERWIRIGTII